jgi:transaldolase
MGFTEAVSVTKSFILSSYSDTSVFLKMSKIHEINKIGQSIWLDSISRTMLRSGYLVEMIEKGVSGLTSNPTIFDKAVAESDLYDDEIKNSFDAGRNVSEIFESIAVSDVRSVADLLFDIYKKTQFLDGYVSIEVSPKLANNSEGTITEAKRIWASIDRPNIMIKVPGTGEGANAIRTLIGLGINVNVTLLFSVEAYRRSANAYLEGLQDYLNSGGTSISKIASVASFFVSRIDTAIDSKLTETSLKGKAGVTNARNAYKLFTELFDVSPGGNFNVLSKKGAQFQRPLWASTSVKNPSYPETMYVDQLMGPHTVNTVPENTFFSLLHNATTADRLTNIELESDYLDELTKRGLSIEKTADELLEQGIQAFTDSYNSVLRRISNKLKEIA